MLPPGTPHRGALGVDDLAAMPLVAPPEGSSSRDLLDSVLATRGHAATVVVESAQREALLPLVLAGAGAALVPTALAETAGGSGARSPTSTRRSVGPSTLVRRDAEPTPAAAAFLELAAPRR